MSSDIFGQLCLKWYLDKSNSNKEKKKTLNDKTLLSESEIDLG